MNQLINPMVEGVFAHICEYSILADVSKSTVGDDEKLAGPFNTEIRARMRELNMRKLEEFADRFGLGRTTVYSLVLGRRSETGTWIKPSLDTTVALSRALDLSPNTIIKRLWPDISLPEDNKMHRVTIVGLVGAGPGQLFAEDTVVMVPSELARGRELVAFRVVGDSMCSHRRPICDGDIIVVNRLDKGSIGAIIVARLDDNSYRKGAWGSTKPTSFKRGM